LSSTHFPNADRCFLSTPIDVSAPVVLQQIRGKTYRTGVKTDRRIRRRQERPDGT
jgi:hypothetical protein